MNTQRNVDLNISVWRMDLKHSQNERNMLKYKHKHNRKKTFFLAMHNNGMYAVAVQVGMSCGTV